MNIKLKKILGAIAVTIAICTGIILLLLLNPTILYAEKSDFKHFTIYHTAPLPAGLITLLDESLSQLEDQEVYHADIHLHLCLNDGSIYPDFVYKLMGPDLIRSFANVTVIHADTIDINSNKMVFAGEKNESFKASQLFVHAFTHCLQFKHYGFFNSNPFARHEEWKWEGYAEYTSLGVNVDLIQLIDTYESSKNEFWVATDNGFKTIREHLKYCAMIKFCTEIRQMSFDSILETKQPGDEIYADILKWRSNRVD